jgi:hypothetical protein
MSSVRVADDCLELGVGEHAARFVEQGWARDKLDRGDRPGRRPARFLADHPTPPDSGQDGVAGVELEVEARRTDLSGADSIRPAGRHGRRPVPIRWPPWSPCEATRRAARMDGRSGAPSDADRGQCEPDQRPAVLDLDGRAKLVE